VKLLNIIWKESINRYLYILHKASYLELPFGKFFIQTAVVVVINWNLSKNTCCCANSQFMRTIICIKQLLVYFVLRYISRFTFLPLNITWYLGIGTNIWKTISERWYKIRMNLPLLNAWYNILSIKFHWNGAVIT